MNRDEIRSNHSNPLADYALVLGMGVAALALGRGLQLNNGHYLPDAMFWVAVSSAAMLCATLLPRFSAPQSVDLSRKVEGVLVSLLALGVVAQLAQLLMRAPGIYLEVGRDSRNFFVAGIVAAAAVVGAAAIRDKRIAEIGAALLLLIHCCLGVWIVNASPEPHIDVYVFQNEALAALLGGENPYAVRMPNIYGPTAGYAAEIMDGDRLTTGYPYPPLTLLLALPGYLLGDVRYALVAAGTLAGALLAFAKPGRVATLATAVWLFSPRVFFVYEQSWIEPFLVLLLAAVLFCSIRWPKALPYVFGGLCAAKQYCIFLPFLVPLLLPRPLSWRALWSFQWRAGAVAVVLVFSPFAIAAGAYWHSVFELQFLQPFRKDALSFLVYWMRLGNAAPGSWPGFAGASIAIALALWRMPRSAAGFAGGSALVYMAFFALNKQAFCNYYFFVIAAAVGAVALGLGSVADPRRSPPGAVPDGRALR